MPEGSDKSSTTGGEEGAGTAGDESATAMVVEAIKPTSFACRWEGCGAEYDDIGGLYQHVMDLHVAKNTDAVFMCRWQDCIRAAKPFTHRPSITAHIRTHVPIKALEKPAAPQGIHPVLF